MLIAQPLLLLVVVAALGLPLGQIRIGGARLGTAAVLFVGLAIGAIDERLHLPDIVYLLGLSMLVYTIGLSSASSFGQILSKESGKRVLTALLGLTLAAIATYFASRQYGITGPQAAGMFGGAFTNASGLASAVDAVTEARGNTAEPVVGYSLAYPVGVFGPMLVMILARAAFRVNLAEEALTIPAFRKLKQKLSVVTVVVTNPAAFGKSVAELASEPGHDLIFGRVRRGDHEELANGGLVLQEGDLVTVVGSAIDIEYAEKVLGQRSNEALELDRSEFDVRRIFVSRPDIAGRSLKQLNLPQHQQALLTRVRRGDLDFVPNGDTVLELGDRVRVLARRKDMEGVSKFFGDSYRALAEVDLLSFCLGLALGLLLGSIPIPLPGGSHFKLGFAGGPLVMALILGRMRRTGKIVWSLPYSANLTLRQFGLLLFSAGIGTRAGFDFFNTLSHGEGMNVFLVGLGLTAGSGVVTMLFGYYALKIPLNVLFGVYAGAQTQPVSLGFAVDQTKNDLATGAYSVLFPIATIYKIIITQMLLLSLGIPPAIVD